MKLKLKIILSIVIAFLFMGLILKACESEDSMRNNMLKKTPIGINFDQVLEYCSKEKLKCKSFKNFGYLNQNNHQTVGVQSIESLISEYQITPLITIDIKAYWGFDQYGKLINILVSREADSL